jgi:hypothetical protein
VNNVGPLEELSSEPLLKLAAYAQPLFDQTDGSIDKMNRAMMVAPMCWNLAILSEGQREKAIDELKPTLNMTDGEFAEFRQHVVLPMIQRHREIFPGMHAKVTSTWSLPVSSTKKYPGTGTLPSVGVTQIQFCRRGNDQIGETFHEQSFGFFSHPIYPPAVPVNFRHQLSRWLARGDRPATSPLCYVLQKS